MIELLHPTPDKKISLATPVQREFIMNEKTGIHKQNDVPKNTEFYSCGIDGGPYKWLFNRYANNWGKDHITNPNEVVLSAPEFIKFSWKADVPSHIEIFFADDTDYPRNPEPCEVDYVYECDGITTASMCNFMINTRYAWKVVADDGSQESETRYFTTADDYPRMLYVQGTANVRDMGGAKTYDGKSLRQGRIYRGGELESELDRQYLISQRGRRTLHDVLKIHSEMDLRGEAVGHRTGSNIGDDVIFKIFPTNGYKWFFIFQEFKEVAENAYNIFEFLSDEDNYPIYMHCTAGADRTGTIAYIIEILCGVKIEYMSLNYNITSLSLHDLRYQQDRMFFLKEILSEEEQLLPDEELSKIACKRIEEMLIEQCGVKPEWIENLRRIMTE